jgi:hypothetical protein
MVLDATTQRLRECACGSRYITTETVTRRLPPAPTSADTQPPGNVPPTPRQRPGNRSAQYSDSDQGIPLPISEADPDQTRARAEQPVFQFDVVANGGKPWALLKAKHEEFGSAFPAVDRMAEYRKISAWISSNPVNRKTPRGMPSFLFRWLSRAQDRGGSSPRLPVSSVPDPRCPFHRQAGTNNRPSRFPHPNCPECKHAAAARGERRAEPTPAMAIVPATREELEGLRRGNG